MPPLTSRKLPLQHQLPSDRNPKFTLTGRSKDLRSNSILGYRLASPIFVGRVLCILVGQALEWPLCLALREPPPTEPCMCHFLCYAASSVLV